MNESNAKQVIQDNYAQAESYQLHKHFQRIGIFGAATVCLQLSEEVLQSLAKEAPYLTQAALKDRIRAQKLHVDVGFEYRRVMDRKKEHILTLPCYASPMNVIEIDDGNYNFCAHEFNIVVKSRKKRKLNQSNSAIFGDLKKGAIFTCEPLLKKLSQSKNLFVDGYFNIKTGGFKQLVTLGIQEHGVFLPVAYMLTDGSSYDVYYEFFLRIYIRLTRLRYELSENFRLMSDFESAIRKAALDAFRINCEGCLFHYKQSVVRKIKSLGDDFVTIMEDRLNELDNVLYYRNGLSILKEKQIGTEKVIEHKMTLIQPQIKDEKFLNKWSVFTDYMIQWSRAQNQLRDDDCVIFRSNNSAEAFYKVLGERKLSRIKDPSEFIATLKQVTVEQFVKFKEAMNNNEENNRFSYDLKKLRKKVEDDLKNVLKSIKEKGLVMNRKSRKKEEQAINYEVDEDAEIFDVKSDNEEGEDEIAEKDEMKVEKKTKKYRSWEEFRNNDVIARSKLN